ncbi:adenylate cyclase 1 [mine drainage metagenome]|uniref:Adenylate cyclase 1 n=1 Tax=mine drainage metagenome TaxID=410659 RepID=A0A1J5QFF7_9ZZZZ
MTIMVKKFAEFLRRYWPRILLSQVLLAVFIMHAVGALPLQFVDRMENLAYDLRLNLTMPGTLDKRIVIVDIDEKSLQEQGRWPWSRNKLAQLVDKLFDQHHIRVLGFDVVFAEKDESSGLPNLERIGRTQLKSDAQFNALIDKIRPQLDYDQVFADSLKGRQVVLGYYFRRDGQEHAGVGELPAPAFAAGSLDDRYIGFIRANSFGANLPLLQQNALTGGHFNPQPDADGLTRRIALLQEYRGAEYEALSLAVARVALGVPRIEAGLVEGYGDHADLEEIRLGRRHLPVDDQVAALIPYRGRQGSFRYISATDVLQDRVPQGLLDGAIVLVGTTAPGLMDLRATPVQSVYPGVEVHANMIAGILDQNIKQHPPYIAAAEVVMLLLMGLLLAFVLPALSPLWATLLTGTALALVTGLNIAIWQQADLVLPLASGLLMVLAIFILNMSYGFFVESRGKRQLAGLFGQYVPPELVGEMAKNPAAYSQEGESRELTVLFSDVRGFTTISEGLAPKELTELMNAFLTPMTHVIHRHRGTIDKYMGDAIMAFWGAPLADPEHARHALEAALDMIAELGALQARFEARGWPPISIGVGLNTGEMIVGNMGSEFRMAYTVMGDAVNLGSRLEGLTKEYGVHIIVSEFTRAAVPDFLFRELDLVRVKGKDKPVAIFEPIGPAGQEGQATREELERYQAAYRLYRAQNWDQAEMQLLELQKQSPQRKLYQLYVERIAYYRQNPPGADWDGAFTFKTK